MLTSALTYLQLAPEINSPRMVCLSNHSSSSWIHNWLVHPHSPRPHHGYRMTHGNP